MIGVISVTPGLPCLPPSTGLYLVIIPVIVQLFSGSSALIDHGILNVSSDNSPRTASSVVCSHFHQQARFSLSPLPPYTGMFARKARRAGDDTRNT